MMFLQRCRCIEKPVKLSNCLPIFKSALHRLQKSHSSLIGLCHVTGLYYVLKYPHILV